MQPTLDQAGLAATVLLRVTDTKGSVALQSFTVNAVAINYPPVITSTAVTNAYQNVPYNYAVAAQDPENESLTYSFTSSVPSGMTINSSTGVISWPTPTSYGSAITVQAADSHGAGTQTFSISF